MSYPMSTQRCNLVTYSDIFNQHLEETRQHLQKPTPHANSTKSSFIGFVEWTHDEIDAFFYALAVHSRFQPDLISAHIRSKNVLEVIEFLDLLEQGSERLGEQITEHQAPVAYEMSNEWISWEEKQAELLRAQDNNSAEQPNQEVDIGPSVAGLEDETKSSRELSPVSRRREQKRMCMRRKRAKKRGEVVNATVSLLKKGRPTKASKIPAPLLNMHAQRNPSTSLMSTEKSFRYQSLSNLSQTNNHQATELSANDMDQPITSMNSPSGRELELIHTPNLRNFMRFHVGLYDKKLLNGNEDIHHETLDLLSGIIQDFISETIGRAVILLEEQIKMKGSIKVWRQNNSENERATLNRSIINQTLESMGFGIQIRKQYIRDLLLSFDRFEGNNTDTFEDHKNTTIQDPHCVFLPRSFQRMTKSMDVALSNENDDSWEADQELLLDKKDSLANWVHETGLWNQLGVQT